MPEQKSQKKRVTPPTQMKRAVLQQETKHPGDRISPTKKKKKVRVGSGPETVNTEKKGKNKTLADRSSEK